MHTTINWNVRQLRTALFCTLAALAICGNVHAKPNIDGAWKLSKPQTLLTPANGEPIPFTPQGKKLYEQNKASAQKGSFGFDEVTERCASPGMPRIMLSPYRFKIFDRPGMVMFKFEWNRLYRQVDMRDDVTIENSKPLPRKRRPVFPSVAGGPPSGPPGAAAPGGAPGGPPAGPLDDPNLDVDSLVGTQMGHARGHWDGDVLVIEVNELADYKLIDGLIQTSDELKLVERFRLRDKNTLEHRIMISDSVTFTKTWEAILTYSRQPDEALMEDVCLERKQVGESPWPKPL